ncbi:CYFA0S33e00188g1_1 [Cyberlindnera fabianii]|uniref:CYFA0S33e00188g1_1 n=1 Tax=Cyberlindnera fabianii TaxID=36022 RepID=A0A061BDS8_CYBFA|nr:CYFA0S33e00188g1_1 [Cyberlindnera fabianii]
MLRGSTRVARVVRPLCRFQSTQAAAQSYTVIEPPNLKDYKESGITGLLSTEGLKNAYYTRKEEYAAKLGSEITRHQHGFEDRLDVLVTHHSQSSTKKGIHDYASLLYNINFAYSVLGRVRGSVTEIPSTQTVQALFETPDLSAVIDNQPPQQLTRAINRHFGSLVEFKTLLLNSANAINGDGFTWVLARRFRESVSEKDGPLYDKLYIVNTYNAGSPFDMQRSGQITEHFKKDPENKEIIENRKSSTVLSFFEAHQTMVGGYEYIPILCVDASPKAWLTDYGVYGKKAYLEQWWRSIDWETVEKLRPNPFMDY